MKNIKPIPLKQHLNENPDKEEFLKLDFIIEESITISNLKLTGCTFSFTDDGSLIANECNFSYSKFIGIKHFRPFNNSSGNLSIKEGSIQSDIEIKGCFSSVNLDNAHFRFINDSSITDKYNVTNSDFYSSKINGETRSLTLTNVNVVGEEKVFGYMAKMYSSFDRKSFRWNKSIFVEAICSKVSFNNIKINPFYLSVKCINKDTIDLSGAYLIDDWSRLRKKYSGINLIIIALLTFIFVLPYLVQYFGLLALTDIVDTNAKPIKTKQLWEVLVFGGKFGFEAGLYCFLTVILLIYNTARLWITITISKLREEEMFLADANYKIISLNPNKYKVQKNVDKILSILFYISIGYSILKTRDFLFTQVIDLNHYLN